MIQTEEKAKTQNSTKWEPMSVKQPAAASMQVAHNTVTTQFQIYFIKCEISLIMATDLSFKVYQK